MVIKKGDFVRFVPAHDHIRIREEYDLAMEVVKCSDTTEFVGVRPTKKGIPVRRGRTWFKYRLELCEGPW